MVGFGLGCAEGGGPERLLGCAAREGGERERQVVIPSLALCRWCLCFGYISRSEEVTLLSRSTGLDRPRGVCIFISVALEKLPALGLCKGRGALGRGQWAAGACRLVRAADSRSAVRVMAGCLWR